MCPNDTTSTPSKQRICVHCGRQFTVAWIEDPKRYCSSACAARHRYRDRLPLTTRQCSHCGKEFQPSKDKQRYCSRLCGARSYTPPPRRKLRKVCPQCGRVFFVGTMHVRQQCCSRHCGGKFAHVSVPLATRFWSHVEKNADKCWLWTGSTNSSGYGHMTTGAPQKRLVFVHRFSWELHNGPIPEGLLVCHDCDVNYPPGDKTYRLCCNPAHLFLGTHQDNTHDMIRKGRSGVRGHRTPKLHPDTVRAIRDDFAHGMGYAAITSRHSTTIPVVRNIVRGHTYKYVS